MKILVLGCNGMAGHMISLYFHECGYEVYGLARSESKIVPTFICDVSDFSKLKEIIVSNQFDVIINCIGVLNKYAEDDKVSAVKLNSLLPHFLVAITAQMKTKIIHMSTDCVFSGKQGNYTESDLPDGTTFYDRSKALGEINDRKNLTLRNSIIGPDINVNGIGLLNWFLMNSANELNGYSGAIWSGQTTLQLAKTMEIAIHQNAVGLINAVPEKSITKYELLCLFNDVFLNGQKNIIEVEGVVADKSLKRTNWEFNYIIPSYEEMLLDLYDWMKKHRNLYPHYLI